MSETDKRDYGWRWSILDKKEFSMFAMALKTYYPRESILPNEQAMALWYAQLQDIPYKVAEASLNKWVNVSKWSPSIADIREESYGIIHGASDDWGQAWQEVCKAIQNYGIYRQTEALDSLSPMARKVTERIGFKNLCMSENQDHDRANFRKIYEQLDERERKEAQMPEHLKNMIAGMQNKMIEGGRNESD
jgi:hypothetical protein